jgi:RNA polymerase sigma-70 factor (family 1)
MMTTSYQSYSDNVLIALVKSGDIDAFTEIHNRYYVKLYSHAYKRLPDREEVKDILQELFVSVWNNRETIELKVALPAYLYTAVRNRILNAYKHEKVKTDYLAAFQNFLDNHTEPVADEQLRLKELTTMIEAEVSEFPPQMRRVFEMSRNEALSHQEIADELNISTLTVRKHVQNSLKILRAKLSAYLYMFLL